MDLLPPLLAAALLLPVIAGSPQEIVVKDARGLREAVSQAGPGTVILIEPGEYPGGFYFKDLKGEDWKPVVIAGRDRARPPLFKGGAHAFHLSDPRHVELRDLSVSGSTGNGINIDDGGSLDTPATGVVVRRVRIVDVGPEGNRDGLKLSGVDDFRVEDCVIERWGSGGSGIDMVGCHRGVIEGCIFRHDGRGGNGVQAKGGSSGVSVLRNRFEGAGERAVNIGGSTGLQYFRPPLDLEPGGPRRHAEAKDIRVEGNTFVGSAAAVAFVGVDGAVVRWNTIYRPRAWVLRILQETRHPAFVPCREGIFSDNLIAFRSDELRTAANVGPDTAPETFRFARNFWYCMDRPERSRPQLPAAEDAGAYGQDPLLKDPEKGDLTLRAESPARRAGADAEGQGKGAKRKAASGAAGER